MCSLFRIHLGVFGQSTTQVLPCRHRPPARLRLGSVQQCPAPPDASHHPQALPSVFALTMPLLPWGNGHHRASTLTKLPPKLKHKRSASLASHRSTTQLSPASPPSPCESHFTISRPGSLSISETEEAEHGHRLNSEFKSLLRAAPGEADVRQSVRLSLAEWGVQGAGDGDDLAPRRPSLANCRRETGNHSHEEESLLVLPGEEMGVTGKSRH